PSFRRISPYRWLLSMLIMAAEPEGDLYAVAWFDLAGAVSAAGYGDQPSIGADPAGADHRPAAVAGVSDGAGRGRQAVERSFFEPVALPAAAAGAAGGRGDGLCQGHC